MPSGPDMLQSEHNRDDRRKRQLKPDGKQHRRMPHQNQQTGQSDQVEGVGFTPQQICPQPQYHHDDRTLGGGCHAGQHAIAKDERDGGAGGRGITPPPLEEDVKTVEDPFEEAYQNDGDNADVQPGNGQKMTDAATVEDLAQRRRNPAALPDGERFHHRLRFAAQLGFDKPLETAPDHPQHGR